jgi:hypothetical protein
VSNDRVSIQDPAETEDKLQWLLSRKKLRGEKPAGGPLFARTRGSAAKS